MDIDMCISLYSNIYSFYSYYYIEIIIYWYKEVPSLIANTNDTKAKIRATKIWVSLIIDQF
jgi:hypothetical protein